MIDELITFQKRALVQLRQHCAAAHNEYRESHLNQVVSFTAPTGAGKTIIMASLIEDILCGTEQYMEQPDAIFVWLSDSPELNLQSREKIDTKADKIKINQCVVVSDDSFDRETLEEGHIYFLNTQKLSKSSNLTQHSDSRQYTIWETLANTIHDKADKLYFIIDEAHRGMRGNDAGRATTIMQKFIFGSEKDGLPPVPVVIGMSATIERFSQLVKNSSATNRPVRVSPSDVRSSGLLKDRVIIYYPKEASEQKDLAVLQAATDEWLQKCQHWETFCREQHQSLVRPVFVVQVLNGARGNLSETNLDECLAKIEERSGFKFEKGEVVHAFGDTRGVVTIGGLEVPYLEPSKIQDDRLVRVVFFKETLSTGWDCPRAETMMSFRRYVDVTAIAQLLGRMVRTPIHQRIMVDDMLNDVQLFLPHFDAERVKSVVDELQNEEGGELPTDVIGDEIEHGSYVWLTSKQPIRHRQRADSSSGPTLFDLPGRVDIPDNPINLINQNNQKRTSKPGLQTSLMLEEEGIDRGRIIDFINDLALPSYQVRQYQQNNYLVSLFALGRFLLISGLDVRAREKTVNDIVDRMHNYIQRLKTTERYAKLKEGVVSFEMFANVYDAFGEQLKTAPVRNLFSETGRDIELQLRMAEKQLGNEGIAYAYGRKHDNPDAVGSYMADVILFVCDNEQMAQLYDYAKTEYHKLNDAYRQKTTRLSDTLKTQYRNITRDSAEVSETPFNLSKNVLFRNDSEGDEYTDHLFGDDQTGIARIKLNGWEKKVIEEEQKRGDFRCWYRNPSRGTEALALYHIHNGVKKLFYPDFLIVRRVEGGDYIVDILEPHDPGRDDNVSKAKALAQYATENPCIGRAQLMRVAGGVLRRLDFASHSELREKVAVINTNEELEHLFARYGE
ncbi:MAG: DEAD/DEAH box helicase family protein [Bacteroidales bacterium]|nr:DEAD/DEAH box helicase family protein [Bacteroidales bacterium]